MRHPGRKCTLKSRNRSISTCVSLSFCLTSMGKQEKGTFNKFIEKTNFGPGPAAYNSLKSLKNVIIRNKPNFQYYNEEGHNASLIRRTIAAKQHILDRLQKQENR